MLRHRRKLLRIQALRRLAGLVAGLVGTVSPALAQTPVSDLGSRIGADTIVALSALTGVVVFAVLAVISAMRSRGRAENRAARLEAETADLRVLADRAETLLNFDDQRLVVWSDPASPPAVLGALPRRTGVPQERGGFLAFGTWLAPDAAADLDQAVASLRRRGEPFTLALATQGGSFVEAFGRTAGSQAVVRFRDLTGDRLALAALEARHQQVAAELEALKAALDAAPPPVWLRNADGALLWVNRAYARAVEAGSGEVAVTAGMELLDGSARETIRSAHAGNPVFSRRLRVVAAGNRLLYEVVDVAGGRGSAGMAIDVSEVEALQATLRRVTEFHARTLDQLATAVAVYGPDRRLQSYNAAYRALFGLDAGFLDSRPDESMVLDRLRAGRKLPEQADFRSWKTDLLSAYQSLEAREQFWHLPDGQTLRVLANPHPQGGLTWIYENVTARLDLESRYNALIQVQGETLDHLAEGVAVFGSDGRLRLRNPAFLAIWKIDAAALAEHAHISEVVAACARLHDHADMWSDITTAVAGLDEARGQVTGRLQRRDGRVIDYATVPLPEGQTMVTFVDSTDSLRVERALLDRNEALEASDRLKNAFVQHVSYELRSPLTSIIGFSQLIADPRIGPLNERQREYLNYVLASGDALHAIVNDILDLATIDAGIMTLDLAETDVAAAVAGAIEGVRDRLHGTNLHLETDVAANVGSIVADARRLRQILYNLLSNAVGFSDEGGHIALRARRDGAFVEFSVEDQGAGIPDEFLASVFDRFESRAGGAARGGAGLGLSIVKSFVELHGGAVAIRSRTGVGTTVTVRLPVRPDIVAEAAE